MLHADTTAYLERALYRLSGGAVEEAAQDMAQAQALAGDDPRVLLSAGEAYFGLLRAAIYASISAWIGLSFGRWMRSVQR